MYEVEQTLDDLLSKEPPAPFSARIFADPECPNRLCIVGTFVSARMQSNVMGGQNVIVLEGVSSLSTAKALQAVPEWAVDGGKD